MLPFAHSARTLVSVHLCFGCVKGEKTPTHADTHGDVLFVVSLGGAHQKIKKAVRLVPRAGAERLCQCRRRDVHPDLISRSRPGRAHILSGSIAAVCGPLPGLGCVVFCLSDSLCVSSQHIQINVTVGCAFVVRIASFQIRLAMLMCGRQHFDRSEVPAFCLSLSE